MKKLLLVIVLIATTCATYAQVKLEDVVKIGTKLKYHVKAGEKEYDFMVTVKQLVPTVTFDWEMTAPISTSGTIVHSAKGMKNGNTLFNYFSPGIKKLDDQTVSVWLSKYIFDGVNKAGEGAPMKLNVGAAAKVMGSYTGSLEEEILIDGETRTINEELVKELVNGSPSGDDFFTFYNSAKLPIILRMNIGFSIALKEIITK